MNQKMNKPDFVVGERYLDLCLTLQYPTQHTLIGWFPPHIHHQIAFCSLQSNSPKEKKRYGHKQALDIDEANTVSITAQLLKACGTTPATPVKLRKASENLETPQRGKQFTSSQFDSWISSYSDAVFHLDEKKPEAYGEEVSEQTPSSCVTYSQNSAKISTGYRHAGEES
ncbi:hypothetical protein Bca101_035790 [Brassica carinata]